MNRKCDIKKFVKMNYFINNMNEEVKSKKITNYCFEEEIDELIKGLNRLKKSNVLIIGKAGIGKTALVEKLCEKINNHDVPEKLQNVTVLEVPLGSAVAGTRYRGDFEERIRELLEFISDRDDVILFIDEIHNILSCGRGEGAIAFGDILKPYMARGKIKMIGATTLQEYKKTIKRNKAMDRRFYKLNMDEPNTQETIDILRSCKNQYEKHYDVDLTDWEIINIVLRSKLLKGSFPDKALDLLEDYCYDLSLKK